MKDIRTLKTMISHLMVILTKKQRRQMVGMFFVILIGAFLELLGVSTMMPFVQALLTPDELMGKPYIKYLMGVFNINDAHSVLVMVGIGIVIIYIVKNLS